LRARAEPSWPICWIEVSTGSADYESPPAALSFSHNLGPPELARDVPQALWSHDPAGPKSYVGWRKRTL